MATAKKVTVYHNPVCGKSRGALEILDQRGIDHEVIEYLKSPLDRATLEHFLDLLPGAPAELLRKDKRFKELALNEADYQTRAQVVDVLLKHPELMERPVVIHDGRAIIARPSEKVLELFD
ncbi:MAG: arsenate reductase (glutaredoxin) [Candidatus Binatia bacterium]